MKADRPSRASRSETDRMVQSFLDASPDGVVVMDTQGLVIGWNGHAQAMFGWTADEAVGRTLADLIIPEAFRDAHRRGLERFLATGEGPLLINRSEQMALHRSGDEFPIELSLLPLGQGETTVFVGFIRDLTERRRALAALRRQAREAELVNQVTMLAGESGSLDEALAACLAAVCELTGWPTAHALLPAPTDPPTLVTSNIWHGDAEAFASLREITAATSFTLDQGMPGRIWRQRGPSWLADDGGESPTVELPRAPVLRSLNVRAIFGFPIIISGEVAAVLEFFSQDATRPDPQLMLTVRTIGEQVGRVLERRRVQDHQALLLAELDHRAMNLLSVVMGMADQTARRARSVEDFHADFYGRLTSLARAYGLLTSKGWRPTELSEIIEQIVRPYLPEGEGRFSLSAESLLLEPKAGMALSMILHELAANATKYGAFSRPSGRLAVTAEVRPGERGRRVVLEWRESGLTGLDRPERRGFGAKLIEASVRGELGGEMEVKFAPEGVRYRFEFPERPL